MAYRTKVTGTRSATLWLLVVIVVVLIAGMGLGVPILWPRAKGRQDLETHYQAGVTVQEIGARAADATNTRVHHSAA